MKCTIEGFNQQQALSLSKEVIENGKSVIKKIDVLDLVILRWFTDFYHKMVKMEFEGKQYAWVDYKSLLKDMPILDMGKDNLYKRFKKLVLLGVLNHYTSKNGGTFSYYTFGENFTSLLETSQPQNYEGTENFTEGSGIFYGEGTENFTEQNNQSTNNNKSTKYNKKENLEQCDDIFQEYNNQNIIHHKEMKDDIVKAITKALSKHSKEEIILSIQRYGEMYHSGYEYCNYKWNLKDFLTRDKGVSEFLDEGSKWNNYLNFKNQPKKSVSSAPTLPEFVY